MDVELTDGSALPNTDAIDEDVIDDKKLQQMFGVREPLTFYGFMNMKTSVAFPMAASGDNLVEDAVENILKEKALRIKTLLP